MPGQLEDGALALVERAVRPRATSPGTSSRWKRSAIRPSRHCAGQRGDEHDQHQRARRPAPHAACRRRSAVSAAARSPMSPRATSGPARCVLRRLRTRSIWRLASSKATPGGRAPRRRERDRGDQRADRDEQRRSRRGTTTAARRGEDAARARDGERRRRAASGEVMYGVARPVEPGPVRRRRRRRTSSRGRAAPRPRRWSTRWPGTVSVTDRIGRPYRPPTE